MVERTHQLVRYVIFCAVIAISTFGFSATSAYSSVDQMSGWGSCDACAGIGAAGAAASRVTSITGTPSLDGRSRMFSIASSHAFADAIWWKSMAGNDSKSHFTYDFYFYIKNPGASEALEFDVNQSAGGRRYVYGTQCGINYDHQWDVWDTAGGHWVKTGVPCTGVQAYAWNHVTWEFSRSNGQIHFIAVTLNGNKSYVNRTYNSKAWGGGGELNVAFQMDQTGSHTTFDVWLDKITVTQY